jgi:nucleotide-binding universal stress UspA family protein
MPRVETILLATDLTGASSAATAQAIDLAVRLDARLLVVTVVEPSKGGISRRGIEDSREARSRQAQAVVNEARAHGADASFLVWEGEAGDGIVATAASERADLIVVGTHGRGTVGRFILGSVSDHVVHNAGCAVLVVRTREDGPVEGSAAGADAAAGATPAGSSDDSR